MTPRDARRGGEHQHETNSMFGKKVPLIKLL